MGPLAGVKVVELGGIGPGPMCAMLLADLGATVLRIERTAPVDLGIKRPLAYNLLLRNRCSVALDLKQPAAVGAVLDLISKADALIEGFRPGVTERLGLGPDVCLQRNPRLIYGRMTGWGQTGPLAQTAAHDTNYIAITGVLNAIGRKGHPPSIPLNIVGDYAGGSLYLALGILAGILETRQSGKGQVVDASIVDGTLSLATQFFGMLAAGIMSSTRGANMIDSGSHYVECYECKDGNFVSVAAIEKRFHDDLFRRMNLDPREIGDHMNPSNWAKGKEILSKAFSTKTRDEWTTILEGTDTCFAPVLSWEEAPHHPHLKARGSFTTIDGVVQPTPAPRFSRTVPDTPKPPQETTPATVENALAAWLDPKQIAALRNQGVIP